MKFSIIREELVDFNSLKINMNVESIVKSVIVIFLLASLIPIIYRAYKTIKKYSNKK